MEIIGQVFDFVLSIFQLEFTLFGFTITFWQVFLFDFAVGIVAFILREVLLGE